MRIFRFSIWKITSLILFILVVFVAYEYLREYKKNLIYKQELKFIQKNLEKTKKESQELQKQVLSLKHPLNLEKEKKDKFGEALEGEKVILVSDELLQMTALPIFKELPR